MNRTAYFILIILFILSCKRNRTAQQIDQGLSSKQTVSTTVKSNQDVIPNDKILSAKIIRILDGDTVEILYDQLPIKLRLEHIDAPEKRGKQPFGNRAKKALSDLCFGQFVKIHSEGKFDRNGRLIGVIFNKEGQNLNKEMVRIGMAWHYKKYSDDQSYDSIEKEARIEKVGLWKDPNAIAPWDFR